MQIFRAEYMISIDTGFKVHIQFSEVLKIELGSQTKM